MTSPDPVSRLPVFFSAPHRVFFAGGCLQLLAALVFWLVELSGRALGSPFVWPYPATWLHGGFMLFQIFPWFIMGFLMTALPKWMSHGPLVQGEYLPPFALMLGGALIFDLALLLPVPAWPGLLLSALGMLTGIGMLLRVTRRGEGGRAHAYAVLVALAIGSLGALVFGHALKQMDAHWQTAAVSIGVWGFLAPLFFIIYHRMLPFFTGSVLQDQPAWRPMSVLWGMLGLFAAHGLLQFAGFSTLLPDLAATGLAWLLLVRWGFRRTLGIPMLAMLHWGWFWCCVALSLYSLQSLLALAGVAWGGLAPLHALGMGYFLSALIGMGTRVTLGHSGRPIQGDRWGWRCFLVLQVGILLRLAGEFIGAGGWLNLLALLVVSGAFTGWALVHGRMYFSPRPDGQPG